ncbi:MAG: imidazolonepropionase [Pedobacter sp.]|nr:MAG: imidazolonepropionase [Pedobacter sp.]
MRLLIKNLKSLVGIQRPDVRQLWGLEMQQLSQIDNAWLLIEGEMIADFGEMQNCPPDSLADQIIDATGKFCFPSWCDSHSHIVFAASREEEFKMKIEGKTYAEIAAAGGGILNSAAKMATATEEDLFSAASERVKDVIKQGTGALEIKSGYGLSYETELKMLRVIKRLKETFPIPIKATLLAAHAIPKAYANNRSEYIDMIIDKLIPEVSREHLADYVDVFCEEGFFTLQETKQILDASAKYGLKPKIHVNQLSVSGGVELGVQENAISVDHLEETNEAAIQALSKQNTIATLLPSCSFYLNIPFANAREMINQQVSIAIASDYNPGSTPSGNMNLVVSLACIKLKMTPEEAINAATLNGAAAMEISDNYGSITKGKVANLFLTRNMSSVAFLPYSFGQNQQELIILKGNVYHG